MSVTRAHITERGRYLHQIDAVLSSHILQGSESLCRLLRYLAEHAVDHPGVPLKEYQIATEVFGRSSDFDPQVDSTVRVQAGRLRIKLAEYYGSEGSSDPIIVDLPKGTYILAFHDRAVQPTPHEMGPHRPQNRDVIPSQARPELQSTFALLAILITAALILVGIFLAERRPGPMAPVQGSIPAAFHLFWDRFTTGPEEAWVIFSNGAFVGRPETGMRYFDPKRDSRDRITSHYTGVGEVLAMHDLDGVFALMGRHIRVKRGSLFSLDDAQNNNLIFVGSPAENLNLRDIPNSRQFVFRQLNSGPHKGDLAILNLHPQKGEPDYFIANSPDPPLLEDYAVVTLSPGMNPARQVLILAGTTTIGTEAATEYVCRQSSLEELLSRLGVSSQSGLKPFEAVLRVKVTRGVPVETSLVALRPSETPN
jgi:hypothetical protein